MFKGQVEQDKFVVNVLQNKKTKYFYLKCIYIHNVYDT